MKPKKRGAHRVQDTLLTAFVWIFSFITVGMLLWIFYYILSNGISHITWDFLTTAYKGKDHGILPMIITTLYIVLISVLISTPIGICSSIYLTEYSRPGKIVNLIRFATESLAGIPSIIYGLFGFVFFVVALKMRFSILSGSLTLSIMVLPTIIRTTEEALKSVPIAYREGSLALGATKLWTITRVVLPSAIPGILTAVILSIGRIVGETAALVFTAGTATQGLNVAITDTSRTLSVHLYMLAKEGLSLNETFATATVLIIMVAIINFLASRIASRMKRGTTGV